jgi:septum site-determining protein MinD
VKSRSIAVASGKGGVGKTSVASNVATALAMAHERVCVVDLDLGLRNLDVVMGLEGRVVFDLVDVLEGRAELSDALVADARSPGLAMLAAAQRSPDIDISESDIRSLVQALFRQGFERVLLDAPAGIGRGFELAAAAAEGALLVVNPEVASVRDADRVVGLLERAGITEARLVINRLRPHLVRRGDMLSIGDLQEILGIRLIGIIPEDEALLIATNLGTPVALAEERPRESAARAFHDLARRMRGDDVAYPDIYRRQGPLAALRRFFGGE